MKVKFWTGTSRRLRGKFIRPSYFSTCRFFFSLPKDINGAPPQGDSHSQKIRHIFT